MNLNCHLRHEFYAQRLELCRFLCDLLATWICHARVELAGVSIISEQLRISSNLRVLLLVPAAAVVELEAFAHALQTPIAVPASVGRLKSTSSEGPRRRRVRR